MKYTPFSTEEPIFLSGFQIPPIFQSDSPPLWLGDQLILLQLWRLRAFPVSSFSPIIPWTAVCPGLSSAFQSPWKSSGLISLIQKHPQDTNTNLCWFPLRISPVLSHSFILSVIQKCILKACYIPALFLALGRDHSEEKGWLPLWNKPSSGAWEAITQMTNGEKRQWHAQSSTETGLPLEIGWQGKASPRRWCTGWELKDKAGRY